MTIHVYFDEFANNDFTQLPAASDWSCISQDSIKFLVLYRLFPAFLDTIVILKLGLSSIPFVVNMHSFQYTNVYARTHSIYTTLRINNMQEFII